MEEWRNLANKVPADLFSVGFHIEGLLVTVATTRSKLDALVSALKARLAEEAPRGDISDNLATLLRWPIPSLPFDDLDGAIRELARLNALHARAHHAFLLYGGHVGLEVSDDEQWTGWKQRHDDALHHAEAALQRLRTAASLTRAADDAVRSARSCPRASLRWDGWMKAAIQLVTYARISVAMAIYALCCMCVAVALEFHDASTVVNH